MTLDQWAAWATVAGGLAVIFGLIKFLLDLRPIKKELNTNGGSSMKDAVNRIEEKLTTHLINSAAKEAEQDTRLKHIEELM